MPYKTHRISVPAFTNAGLRTASLIYFVSCNYYFNCVHCRMVVRLFLEALQTIVEVHNYDQGLYSDLIMNHDGQCLTGTVHVKC